VSFLSRLRPWRRTSRSSATGGARGSGDPADRGRDSAHLTEFVRSRVGVEAYVEPANPTTPTTVLLIATDGEWTRRRVPDPATAWDFARELAIPVYDVNQTGYPQRMRDWTARQRRGGTTR
jgi:hypothetical protein